MSYDPMFDLMTAAVLLVIGVYWATAYHRIRTAYYLTLFVVTAVLFVHQVLSLVFKGKYSVSRLMEVAGFGFSFEVVVSILVTLLMLAMMFAPDLHRFYLRKIKRR